MAFKIVFFMDITSAKNAMFWVQPVYQEDCGTTTGTICLKRDGRDGPVKGQMKPGSELDSWGGCTDNFFSHSLTWQDRTFWPWQMLSDSCSASEPSGAIRTL